MVHAVGPRERLRWFGSVLGFWVLGCTLGPVLAMWNEHGGVFIIVPGFSAAIAGGVVHCSWLYLAPVKWLAKLLPALGIAILATVGGVLGSVLLWHDSFRAMFADAGLIVFVAAALTAIGISKFYIRNKLLETA
jgi:hypothetical protein